MAQNIGYHHKFNITVWSLYHCVVLYDYVFTSPYIDLHVDNIHLYKCICFLSTIGLIYNAIYC